MAASKSIVFSLRTGMYIWATVSVVTSLLQLVIGGTIPIPLFQKVNDVFLELITATGPSTPQSLANLEILVAAVIKIGIVLCIIKGIFDLGYSIALIMAIRREHVTTLFFCLCYTVAVFVVDFFALVTLCALFGALGVQSATVYLCIIAFYGWQPVAGYYIWYTMHGYYQVLKVGGDGTEMLSAADLSKEGKKVPLITNDLPDPSASVTIEADD